MKVTKNINVTEREVEALQNVLNMYLMDEYKDCQMCLELNNGLPPEEWIEGNHIWYDLNVIDNLIKKLK